MGHVPLHTRDLKARDRNLRGQRGGVTEVIVVAPYGSGPRSIQSKVCVKELHLILPCFCKGLNCVALVTQFFRLVVPLHKAMTKGSFFPVPCPTLKPAPPTSTDERASFHSTLSVKGVAVLILRGEPSTKQCFALADQT